MPIFIVMDLSRNRAVRAVDSPMPEPWTLTHGEEFFDAPPGFDLDGPLDELVLVDTLPGGAELVWDATIALATAQALATQHVRHLTASRLAKTGDLPARRAEVLRLDRGNPDAIAAWFAVLGEREGVRVASNATQDAIATATSGADAWALADAWAAAGPVPAVPPPPIVSRAAFFQRLGVTPAEQADPVMQVAWQHLGLREYVDLRLAGAFLAPLVAVGKLTQARVDAALDASTVSWVERHLSL